MADFEEASAAGFQHVYPDACVAGCWFHYAQAIIMRTDKIGQKEAHGSDEDVQNVVQCHFTGFLTLKFISCDIYFALAKNIRKD